MVGGAAVGKGRTARGRKKRGCLRTPGEKTLGKEKKGISERTGPGRNGGSAGKSLDRGGKVDGLEKNRRGKETFEVGGGERENARDKGGYRLKAENVRRKNRGEGRDCSNRKKRNPSRDPTRCTGGKNQTQPDPGCVKGDQKKSEGVGDGWGDLRQKAQKKKKKKREARPNSFKNRQLRSKKKKVRGTVNQGVKKKGKNIIKRAISP